MFSHEGLGLRQRGGLVQSVTLQGKFKPQPNRDFRLRRHFSKKLKPVADRVMVCDWILWGILTSEIRHEESWNLLNISRKLRAVLMGGVPEVCKSCVSEWQQDTGHHLSRVSNVPQPTQQVTKPMSLSSFFPSHVFLELSLTNTIIPTNTLTNTNILCYIIVNTLLTDELWLQYRRIVSMN